MRTCKYIWLVGLSFGARIIYIVYSDLRLIVLGNKSLYSRTIGLCLVSHIARPAGIIVWL